MTLILQANSDFEWKVYLPPFLWFIIVLAGLWLYQWQQFEFGWGTNWYWAIIYWKIWYYGHRWGEMEPHRLLCQWKFNQDSNWMQWWVWHSCWQGWHCNRANIYCTWTRAKSGHKIENFRTGFGDGSMQTWDQRLRVGWMIPHHGCLYGRGN